MVQRVHSVSGHNNLLSFHLWNASHGKREKSVNIFCEGFPGKFPFGFFKIEFYREITQFPDLLQFSRTIARFSI